MDAGSNPAISTKIRSFSNIGSPLKNPQIPLITGPAGFLLPVSLSSQSVSNGLDKSTVCHKLGTSRDSILDKHLPLAADLATQYKKDKINQNSEAALLRLKNFDRKLTCGEISLCADFSDIKDYSQTLADKVKLIALKENSTTTLIEARLLCKEHNILPPETSDNYASLNKLTDQNWWFRNLKNLKATAIESISRDIGAINKQKSLYCSNSASRDKSFQDKFNQSFLERKTLKNSNGQEFNLAELASKTVSNPEIRRAELMVRIRGFEEVAELQGFRSDFITFTTPSRMHAYLSSGHVNSKYDGTTPKQANDYLCYQWQKIRSEFHKKDIRVFGFRVAEPHHDGTPHHHYLLFSSPSDRDVIHSTFSRYALQDSPDEKGAKQHRFKIEEIDKSKGGATSYIAKYISKSIDGFGLDKDLHENNSQDSAHKIRTWAGLWGIRQFQQIGGPSVSVWRQLRRLNNSLSIFIGPALAAADSSNWAAFVLAMGGPTVKRKDAPISPEYNFLDSIDTETGEIIKVRHNRYGELVRPPISGLFLKNHQYSITTKILRWHESKKLEALEPIERLSSDKDESWSIGSSANQPISKQIFNTFKHGLSHIENSLTEALASPRALADASSSTLRCAIRGADVHAELGLV